MAWTVHEINKPENIQHKRKRGAIVEPVHNPYEVGNTIEFCPPADRGRGYSTNKVQGVIIAIKGDRVIVQYKLSERLKPITTEIRIPAKSGDGERPYVPLEKRIKRGTIQTSIAKYTPPTPFGIDVVNGAAPRR